MTKDEDYGFDVSGYIHLSKALTNVEVDACNAAIDTEPSDGGEAGALAALAEHPVLAQYVEALCGSGFVLDQPPQLVTQQDDALSFTPLSPEECRRLKCDAG
ncbi:MAG: hypothetical protein CME24_14950 [Gemmatimonadetes bacterium]|nr:hypothetical protein [Gemmatimonadota bacterium]